MSCGSDEDLRAELREATDEQLASVILHFEASKMIAMEELMRRRSKHEQEREENRKV